MGKRSIQRRERESRGDRLDLAIEAWRTAEVSEPTLGQDARSRILQAALSDRDVPAPSAWTSLFMPRRFMVAAGIVPALLVVAALFVMDRPAPTGHSGPATVTVSKIGDRVVFEIANGNRSHFVSKSTDPNLFDPASRVSVRDGAYFDRAAGDADLVFYRID